MNKWLRQFRGGIETDLDLFCFPHAGGTAAAFRLWPAGLPSKLAVWGVQLPGRPGRLNEPPVDNLAALVEAVVAEMLPHLKKPFAIFGHSMGAVLAFETARALHRLGAPLPQQLVLSSRRPLGRSGAEPDMHGLSDDAFVAEINRRYGGIPAELLQDRDVMSLLLSGLRADIKALETHNPARSEPLPVPIIACGGVDDRTTTEADLLAWKGLTTGPFRLQMFAGGHFYLEPQRRALLDYLSSTLAPTSRMARPDCSLSLADLT